MSVVGPILPCSGCGTPTDSLGRDYSWCGACVMMLHIEETARRNLTRIEEAPPDV